MKATLQFLENKFDEFNNLCFGGKLPPVRIELTSARSFLGKLLYRKIRGPFGIVCGTGNFRMRISKSFELSQQELEDVLIHEMIHYHIALNRIRDNSTHGPSFRKCMSEINQRYGRHVTVSHKSSPGLDATPRHNSKPVFMCISELGKPDLGITVCSEAMAPILSRSLRRRFRILEMNWYFGYNEFIDRYPRSRTPKIFHMKREDLESCLKGMQVRNP